MTAKLYCASRSPFSAAFLSKQTAKSLQVSSNPAKYDP